MPPTTRFATFAAAALTAALALSGCGSSDGSPTSAVTSEAPAVDAVEDTLPARMEGRIDNPDRTEMHGFLTASPYELTADLEVYSTQQLTADSAPAPDGKKYVVISSAPATTSWIIEKRGCTGELGACGRADLTETFELNFAPYDFSVTSPDPVEPVKKRARFGSPQGAELIFVVPQDASVMQLRVSAYRPGRLDAVEAWTNIDVEFSTLR